MDHRDDDLRTVSDFLASDPRAHTVYLKTTVDDLRAEMADGVAHYVPSDDDIVIGWAASFDRPGEPLSEEALVLTRKFLGYADDGQRGTESYIPDIDEPIIDALDRLFRPSQKRSGAIKYECDASRITVSISDRRDRIEYSAEATATSFADAFAGALEAEKTEIARIILMERVAHVTKSWRHAPHREVDADEVRDVVRGVVSMAARTKPPQEYDDRNDPDLIEYAARLRREQLSMALDVIRAGMQMARQVGISDPVEALFDHFATLTAFEGSK